MCFTGVVKALSAVHLYLNILSAKTILDIPVISSHSSNVCISPLYITLRVLRLLYEFSKYVTQRQLSG